MTLGPSLVAAHQLIPAKAVFHPSFPTPPLFGCVRGGSCLEGLILWWLFVVVFVFSVIEPATQALNVSIQFPVLNFLLLDIANVTSVSCK